MTRRLPVLSEGRVGAVTSRMTRQTVRPPWHKVRQLLLLPFARHEIRRYV